MAKMQKGRKESCAIISCSFSYLIVLAGVYATKRTPLVFVEKDPVENDQHLNDTLKKKLLSGLKNTEASTRTFQ